MYFHPSIRSDLIQNQTHQLQHISTYVNAIMKTKPFKHHSIIGPFCNAYSPDRVRPQLICHPDEDKTDQSFKEECDINAIMKQYEEYGVIEHLNRLEPQWVDVPDFDFHESMELIREAREKFEALPASLRERFANDPHNFLEFFTREENRAEGERLGLLTPKPKPAAENPAPSPAAAATPPAATPPEAPKAA